VLPIFQHPRLKVTAATIVQNIEAKAAARPGNPPTSRSPITEGPHFLRLR
jgi:hypothetical protein